MEAVVKLTLDRVGSNRVHSGFKLTVEFVCLLQVQSEQCIVGAVVLTLVRVGRREDGAVLLLDLLHILRQLLYAASDLLHLRTANAPRGG